MNPTRIWIAALTAPLVGISVLTVVLTTYGFLNRPTADPLSLPEALSVAGHTGFLLIFFGAPGAFILELVIGFPGYYALKSRDQLNWLTVTALAAMAGALAFAIPWNLIWGTWTVSSVSVTAGFGAIAGATAGAWFWLMAFFKNGDEDALGPDVAR